MSLIRRHESWRRFALKALLTLAILWLAGSAFASRYRIGFDPQEVKCLPGYSVYLIDLKDRELQRDAVYAFSARGLDPLFKDGTQMVKILRGLPGDTVEVTEQHRVLVNGSLVGEGLYLAERLKVPESRFYGRATLGEDNYWFMGTSPLSFDSRYWGTVKHEQVIGRAYPLF